MHVKIFKDTGFDGITNIEKEINAWLSDSEGRIEVTNMHTALCQVAETATGGRNQWFVVTILYETRGYAASP